MVTFLRFTAIVMSLFTALVLTNFLQVSFRPEYKLRLASERIEALLTVMTGYLMEYAGLKHQIRKT